MVMLAVVITGYPETWEMVGGFKLRAHYSARERSVKPSPIILAA